jgi:uncharacterized protein (DUF305 family)
MKRCVLPGLVLSVVALGLAACSSPEEGTSPGHDMPMMSSPASPGQAADGESFSTADVTFAQMMVPHHEQAIEMSDIVLAADGIDPGVAELAEAIKAAQQPEIDQMNAWLDDWGAASSTSGHDGHGSMDGMMSEGDMAALADADGAEASRLYLEQMIVHHDGAIVMAERELADGRHEGAVAMAEEIIEVQKTEIERMREMLESM